MKKIGMVMFSYPLGVSPLLTDSAALLAQAGYEVHIFIDKPGFEACKAEFYENNIIVHQIPLKLSSGLWAKKIQVFHKGKFSGIAAGYLYQFARAKFVAGLQKLFSGKPGHFPSLKEKLDHYTRLFFVSLYDFSQNIKKHADDSYLCVIGVEPRGLLAATSLSSDNKIPVIYYNMELLLESDCKTTQARILKALERECNQKSYFTVISDERRAKPLLADNGLSPESIVYVPVSTLGKPYRKKTDYLYNKLGIPKNKKIILSAGNIVQWSMSLELAQAAQKWADDLVLVMHTWRTDARGDNYVRQIEKLTAKGKVYLSLDPVEWNVLPELLSSADIGLVFYLNLSINFFETGLSSNKMAQYMQVGLPVITSDYPSFKDIVEKYKCGKCAGNVQEIEKLAGDIFQDYQTYCDNAVKCYRANYDLSKHFTAVLNKIKALNNAKDYPPVTPEQP